VLPCADKNYASGDITNLQCSDTIKYQIASLTRYKLKSSEGNNDCINEKRD